MQEASVSSPEDIPDISPLGDIRPMVTPAELREQLRRIIGRARTNALAAKEAYLDSMYGDERLLNAKREAFASLNHYQRLLKLVKYAK